MTSFVDLVQLSVFCSTFSFSLQFPIFYIYFAFFHNSFAFFSYLFCVFVIIFFNFAGAVVPVQEFLADPQRRPPPLGSQADEENLIIFYIFIFHELEKIPCKVSTILKLC